MIATAIEAVQALIQLKITELGQLQLQLDDAQDSLQEQAAQIQELQGKEGEMRLYCLWRLLL